MKPILLLLLLLLPVVSCDSSGADDGGGDRPEGILRVSGRSIADENGQAVWLRGVAFGNEVWSNTEVASMHHAEIDFERVADMGMNAIRFYLNYRTFEDDVSPYQYKSTGWDWLDLNIDWARKNGVYLILNMHVPQGGFQSLGEGGALWENEENQNRLAALWKAIAERYREEPVIAGYDLVNEPVVTRAKSQWEDLARRLVREIRTVDQNHMIFVERLNAIAGNWGNDAQNNFFLVDDPNVVYEFHFYSPFEFTHQFASWVPELTTAESYPDETKVAVQGARQWYTATFDNPRLPSGTTDWQFYEGVKYKVDDPAIQLGKPVLVARSAQGTAFFDDVVVTEYDAGGNRVRELFHLDMDGDGTWHFWAQNGVGRGGPSVSSGHGDLTGMRISGTTGDANLTSADRLFVPVQGHSYQISGWMKGSDIAANANVQLRIDFETGIEAVHTRNKAYLEVLIDDMLAWSVERGVPAYLGEFGCIAGCFEDDRGGLRWVEDMLDILQARQVPFTYHTYHESAFGIYRSSGRPHPSSANTALIELFTRKLN